MDELKQLLDGSRELGLTLTEPAAAQMLRLLDELQHWNAAYNLTSVHKREDMLTRHLLDSLSVAPYLHGRQVADVGTGAGFPGLPLAIANPSLTFHLIDSNQKKIRFVTHAVRVLELQNVRPLQARVETLTAAALPVDTIVARAVAPLDRLLSQLESLTGGATRVLAMKAHVSDSELASATGGWLVEGVHPLAVPQLDEARCVVVATRPEVHARARQS